MEEFYKAAQEFIDGLFVPLAREHHADHIILDQGTTVGKYQRDANFFRSCKFVIVDRDPRDIYADLMQGGNLIGMELSITHDIDKYIEWHSGLRENAESL